MEELDFDDIIELISSIESKVLLITFVRDEIVNENETLDFTEMSYWQRRREVQKKGKVHVC